MQSTNYRDNINLSFSSAYPQAARFPIISEDHGIVESGLSQIFGIEGLKQNNPPFQ
jgi:hypothetical protein